MIIYLNSYVPGEGYSIKYFDSQKQGDDGFCDGKGQMLEWERKIFTRTGARLFWGIYQGAAFGCVRQLETGRHDENGRLYFHNIAFHEDVKNGQDQDLATWRIALYAIRHYDEFVRQVDAMVFCRDGDFLVDMEMLGKAWGRWGKAGQETARKDLGSGNRKAWLVPEGTRAYFLKNTQAPFKEEDIRQMEFKETGFMNMFFYCSGPETGYLLKQIDASTGKVLEEGKQAGRAMSPNGFAVLTRGGADMALFKRNKVLCFVAKNMESESTDHYGRKKYMSLCFEAKGRSEAMMCQLAAWALLDFPAFCRDMTGCMEVFDGPDGYSIREEELRRIIRRFEKRLYLPKEGHKREWEAIVKPVKENEFRYMVLDASLNYFNKSVKLDVDRKQIGLCIDSDGFQKRKESPLNLSFSEHLYVPEVAKTVEAEKEGRGQAGAVGKIKPGEVQTVEMWLRILLVLGGIAVILGLVFFGTHFFRSLGMGQ